ncbi:MAG: hypothetical protein K9J12_08770 [Melioribacteraceae bacterium]|nr:hypothetical protein [Melioribacteraceae bacterium]MCF8264639.1 hypothetical protein [Melioribacteraceae bacterium]MCF8411987.1 hypothetical protein [Melioribacteraceae bacterium]
MIKKIIKPVYYFLLMVFVFSLFAIIMQPFENFDSLSLLLAVIINSINFVVAIKLFDSAIGKSNQIYLIYTLGGMVGRLFAMLILILLVILFLNIDKSTFILLFFIFYFSLLSLEIVYFLEIAKSRDKTIDNGQ